MENDQVPLRANRLCIRCNAPLEPNEHGNRKAHQTCAYEHKKQAQKEKYKVGNSAKLMIQKNEAIAARLYQMDKHKMGIPYMVALEHGLNFSCPSTLNNRQNKKVYFFDQYGYSIETVNGDHLIFIYHESDFQ
ncbi:MAG: hypothetical protein ABR927_19305 [Bacteroidales bacterium]|jgi:hypothetical protein